MRELSSKYTSARRLWMPLILAPGLLITSAHGQPTDTGEAAPPPSTYPMNPTPGATPGLQELLAGKIFPLTLKLKDLNADWRCLTVGTQLDYASLANGNASNAYYTRGQTVLVGGETYLIAYHTPVKPLDFAALMRAGSGGVPPAPEKLTPNTLILLTLLDLRASGSLKDIRVFNLQQEIGTGEKAGATAAVSAAARNSSSLSNLKQLGVGLMVYMQDYDEVLPPMKDAATLKKSLMPYMKSDQIFISPINKEAYQPNPILSGKKLVHITNPAAIVAFYEAVPAPDGTRGVAFVDGHAKRIKEAEWTGLKKASKIP